ncbi:mannitol-1-phosphate 5-dehydrogenase [Salinicoccus halodurans]|uniref:Mannitol-1-phosphate 5-dehydrogenase n=1 Tax=Salinicoccus halodurans TaxID=407035 RepID=A0A0F7HP16_9STAP|nr:mannitol-1-phosphate 5-dehydrogenase [Salinicoccus halodurans]AKG74851.1 mannitol-1-phosphate 5-dehydrogenase [Salinicoccus halodurans]SFK69465.1 D-mannitol 1-phosphate 5-dehydrogenase [Salinicoccus halodurans]
MKAVHFGAGNIGRGFIGKVLHDNGFEITFADVNKEIIDALNAEKGYTVHIAEENGASYDITGVSGINTVDNPGQLEQAVLEADIITTAVGVNILPIIAKSITPHLAKRLEDPRPLNIIACENAVMATDALKEAITNETGKLTASNIGFPNSAVDRIVPIQKNERILDVKVEPFYEWVIEETEWAGTDKLEGPNYVQDLMPYIERKLFTVNTGHAAIAYYGRTLGYDTVYEAMTDSKVQIFLNEVLAETQDYITAVYDFTAEEQEHYIDKIIKRFTNPHLSDDLNRVGRGVMRKLGPNDRIIKPLVYLHNEGENHEALSKLVMYATKFDNTEDPEQVEMNSLISEKGIEGFLTEHSGLESDLTKEVINTM